MSSWECGVCGHIHKEGELPEKCPICEAPQKMFVEQQNNDEATSSEGGEQEIKKWRCTISGYLHTGTEPPEKCPICEATSAQFEEVVEEESEEVQETKTKRWRCTVCGYIHDGEQPPETCPVCAAPAVMFVEIDMAGQALGEIEKQEISDLGFTAKTDKELSPNGKSGLIDRLGDLVLKLHLHSIFVHFPNGILPAAVVFLAIAVFLKLSFLEPVAYFNAIFVLIMLPMVLFTGYLEWQKRYRGAKTFVFVTKIICALIVLAAVNVLVFWRLLDPQVAAAGSPTQLIYLGVAGGALAAAGIAGHLGGKLVHGTRG